MVLTLSTIRKPVNNQVVDPATGLMREEWQLYFSQLTDQLNSAVGELSVVPPTPAPTDAQYIVSAAHADLSAERVATDTTTVDYDAGTAGQAKWNVLEVPGIASAGLVVRTAAATYAARTLTGPAAGISVSNGDGVAGNPTLALADDLAALEALGSTGFAVRTVANTWAQRTLASGDGITVTNGDGVSGNPSIAFSGSVTPTLGRRNIADITSGDTIIASDQAKLVNIATGTGTLAFTAAATLAAGFWCVIKNSGTGDVTLDPASAELIDGLATWILYPGGAILVQCDGTGFNSVLLSPMEKTFSSSGTFTTPGLGTWIEGEIWGGGGSGGRGALSVAGGGAGGGACVPFKLLKSAFGATETVTIGAGGAVKSTNVAGDNGGNSTLGALVTGYGGVGGAVGANGVGGGGGGSLSVGSGDDGGEPTSATGSGADNDGFGGGAGNGVGGAGGRSHYGGGGGGGGDAATGGAGGGSFRGGAGGGAGGDTTAGGAGGVSLFGGNGGAGATGAANAANGSQPAGGGGGSETGNSGAGGDGRITVRVY